MQVRATPLGDAPDPPKLKKTAPDEIRPGGSFASSLVCFISIIVIIKVMLLLLLLSEIGFS